MKKQTIDPFDSLLSNAINNPEKRYYFYKALLDLEVVAIGTVSSSTNGEQILNLKYIEVNNELVLPVYSSVEKFNSIYKGNYKYVKISTRMLLKLIETDTPWVLNPGFDVSKKIILEELETLRDGRILHYFFEDLGIEEKQSFLTHQMETIPQSVLSVISDNLKDFPSIKNAYYTHIYNPASASKPIPFIGLTVDNQEDNNSEQLVLDVFKTVDKLSNQPIEVVILPENMPLTNSIIDQTEPFYTRTSIDDLKSMFR